MHSNCPKEGNQAPCPVESCCEGGARPKRKERNLSTRPGLGAGFAFDLGSSVSFPSGLGCGSATGTRSCSGRSSACSAGLASGLSCFFSGSASLTFSGSCALAFTGSGSAGLAGSAGSTGFAGSAGSTGFAGSAGSSSWFPLAPETGAAVGTIARASDAAAGTGSFDSVCYLKKLGSLLTRLDIQVPN